jgi:quercetin dioxygenase-like cupin family protein
MLAELFKEGTQMAAAATPSKDPTIVDSKHYTVEYEDERVRVLRIQSGPRERSTMHSHPAMIAVMVSNGKLRMTYPDGTSEDIEGTAGQVMHIPAVEHLPENLQDEPLEVIGVELKG